MLYTLWWFCSILKLQWPFLGREQMIRELKTTPRKYYMAAAKEKERYEGRNVGVQCSLCHASWCSRVPGTLGFVGFLNLTLSITLTMNGAEKAVFCWSWRGQHMAHTTGKGVEGAVLWQSCVSLGNPFSAAVFLECWALWFLKPNPSWSSEPCMGVSVVPSRKGWREPRRGSPVFPLAILW